MATKNRTRKHWIVLLCIACMFAGFTTIINNVIGVFYTPVSEDLNLLRGDFALHSTLTMVAVGIISLLTPNLIYKYGWKKVLISGVALSFIGTAGMAFTESLGVFYILGTIRGIGAGLFGMVPMPLLINNWFHEKNGLAMSLASASSGITGMVLAPVFSSVVANLGWRMGFIGMGVVVILLTLPAMIYPYSLFPEDDQLVPYGFVEETSQSQFSNQKHNSRNNRLKTVMVSFIAMIIFSALHTSVLGINQHLPGYGGSIGMSLQLSGYILTAVLFGNIFFKLVVGPLADRFGAVKATITMNIITAIALVILIATETASTTMVSGFIFGAVFSVGSVALPLLSNEFFGKKLTEKVFPVLAFTSSMGQAFSNVMIGYIFDFTGSYEIAFLIALVFQLVNFGMLYIAYRYSFQRVQA